MTDDGFDGIVTGFYKASTGSMAWVDALGAFQRAVSALAIYVHALDVEQGCVAYSYSSTLSTAEADLDYVRTYHRIDPRANLVLGLAPGEWINCWDYFDDAFVATDPFYQDFLIPYGLRYVSGTKLMREGSLSVILGVHRGNGSPKLNPEELTTCRRLARHLSEALRAQEKFAQTRHEGLLGMELLSRLRAPVALLDEERRVLKTNPAAQAMLAHHGAVSVSGGRLYCRRPREDNALLVALRQLLWNEASHFSGPAKDKLFLRVAGTGAKDTLGLYLYALRPHATLRAFGDQPLVMMLFHEVNKCLELDPFVVAAAFDLTPGEARVAVAAVQGQTADEIARRHKVSVNTVRSQLKAIFQKTGTSGQSQLVGLLAAMPMAALELRSS